MDWSRFQNGFVSLFWARQVLDETVACPHRAEYEIVELDASQWHSATDFHQAIAADFVVPDYYGNNLNPFIDCFGDVALYEYGAHSEATGSLGHRHLPGTEGRAPIIARLCPGERDWQVFVCLKSAIPALWLQFGRCLAELPRMEDPYTLRCTLHSAGHTECLWVCSPVEAAGASRQSTAQLAVW